MTSITSQVPIFRMYCAVSKATLVAQHTSAFGHTCSLEDSSMRNSPSGTNTPTFKSDSMPLKCKSHEIPRGRSGRPKRSSSYSPVPPLNRTSHTMASIYTKNVTIASGF